jgi:DNA helicase IV
LSKVRHDTELAAERDYIAYLYTRLDAERTAARAELDRVLVDASTRPPAARWQREVAATTLSDRIRHVGIADSGLCFGRLDDADGERSYVGRIGLFDGDDHRPLLTDWRAPAARPFYCATSARPDGIRVRRHFRTAGRKVLDFHDDVLDPDSAKGHNDSDAALLAVLNAPREESMRDIVATIQAEQDEIIRLPHNGVLVIEGGPGTGKTAVALHRVAYLLYTQRERLPRGSVLVVGPNPGFLRYIGQVLPSLGETDVVFATTGDLLPGLHVTAQDTHAATRVKGDIAMVDVLTAAVADREELPAEPVAVPLSDGTVWLDRGLVATARERARVTRLRHNEARAVFRDAALTALAQRAVDSIASGWLRRSEASGIRADLTEDVLAELNGHDELLATLDTLWPELTPQRLLAELFGSRQRLAVAAWTLPEADRAALYRPVGDAWTVQDVPLLDEAAELLGRDNTAVRRRAGRRRATQLAYARGVLEVLDTEEDPDGEPLRAVDLIDPDRPADRDGRELAERAAQDREWTYGHVVVDEAQELSDLDWRVLARRCPSRSFTIVGDLAQRQSPAGATHWGGMLDRYVPGRWLHRSLTVNYRMPVEIMDVAAQVLAAVDPDARPPASVRSTGVPPWALLVTEDELPAAVESSVRREAALVGDGSVAVVVPEGTRLDTVVPEGSTLDLTVTVLTPTQAKGLEFDAVIVVQPQRIWAVPDSGATQLYVTLTRATQRLGLLHTEPLPDVLAVDGPEWRDD